MSPDRLCFYSFLLHFELGKPSLKKSGLNSANARKGGGVKVLPKFDEALFILCFKFAQFKKRGGWDPV